MKHLTWWTLPLAAAILFSLAAADCADAGRQEGDKGQQDAKTEKKSSGLRGEYAILVAECDLTAEQKAKLKAKVEARKWAMAKWQQAYGDKAAELKKAMKEAKEAGNEGKANSLGRELKALSAERRRLHEKTMADIYAILTPEQKTTWAGFRLYRQAMRWCKRAGLSDEQQATIRKMADATAKQLAHAADEKAERQITTALRKKIEQNVLTAEQREALEKKPRKERPEKGAAREKKGKKDTGAEG